MEAPKNIQKVINGNYKYKRIEDIPGNGAIAVAAASKYLKHRGYNKLADKYMEIASAYYDMRRSGNIDLTKIKKLYQEAADIWEDTEW